MVYILSKQTNNASLFHCFIILTTLSADGIVKYTGLLC